MLKKVELGLSWDFPNLLSIKVQIFNQNTVVNIRYNTSHSQTAGTSYTTNELQELRYSFYLCKMGFIFACYKRL